MSEFDTLAGFYKPRGIRTKITAKEYIDTAMTGVDLQEKIRNYIIEEFQQYGIEYVLIGGDKEVVPYRGFYCQVASGGGYYVDFGIPADLYYSALDGNWNNDGDDRWGEPAEDDLYPEVAISRMTFSNTAELHNMLHKTMLYQASPVEGEITRPLLAGEHLWDSPVTWGSDYLKLLVGYRTDNGYTTLGIPPTHPRDTLYDRYATWSKTDLMNHINAGRPWLHHVGHSNYIYVMKMDISDITNSNFSQANGINHNYTIVYTHGCMCGGFDQTDCIAEKMVGIDNFAVAFIGNSRYGWFNEGTTDGPSQHLHREFVDALYRDDTLFGAANTNSSGTAVVLVQEGLTEGPVSLVVSGYNILPQYFDIQVSNYWLGWTTNWNDEINWYTRVIPDSTSYVIIPADPEGPEFPVTNTGNTRHCKSICIEPGAQFIIGAGETFSVGGD